MNYDQLECITRLAMRNTLGERKEDFDNWLTTADPNEGIELEELDLGTSVEICFDPVGSPFYRFCSDATVFVTVYEDGVGDVQIFFGESCQDVAHAKAAAESFLNRDSSDGWYIAEDFCEDRGLHLMREFDYEPDDESDLLAVITGCFSELCESEIEDELSCFVHYFNN